MNAPLLYVDYFKLLWDMSDNRCKLFAGTDLPNGWAASFESLLTFRKQVTELKKQLGRNVTILDAGAGASSVMIHYWFPEDLVVSCDPDPAYLETVKSVCYLLWLKYKIPHRLDGGHWLDGYFSNPVDATYFDYDNYKAREDNLPLVFKYTNHVAYFDDTDDRMQCAPLRKLVIDSCESNHWKHEDAIEASDEMGRWGIKGTKL